MPPPPASPAAIRKRCSGVPNLTGLKNEVVVPRYSRNEYDHAVRMLGVKMVEVETAAQFEAAFSPRTAMVMILSCPAAETGELSIPNACAMARRNGVPVVVDAAAETLTIPNIHLAHGANMVAYSGGKCLRGPQAGGLLLGQKDLVQRGLDQQRAAPHFRPFAEGRQGRNHGHARGRGDVGEARP